MQAYDNKDDCLAMTGRLQTSRPVDVLSQKAQNRRNIQKNTNMQLRNDLDGRKLTAFGQMNLTISSQHGLATAPVPSCRRPAAHSAPSDELSPT